MMVNDMVIRGDDYHEQKCRVYEHGIDQHSWQDGTAGGACFIRIPLTMELHVFANAPVRDAW